MSSPLTVYVQRIEWLLQFTTRRIVVVAVFGLAVSLTLSRPVNSLQKSAVQTGQQRVYPTPTPSPTPLPGTSPTPAGTEQLRQDQDDLRVPSLAPNYEA